MHHDATSNLINLLHAVDEYLKSKLSIGLSLASAGVQFVTAPKVLEASEEIAAYCARVAAENSFDWIFLFQCIGAGYVSMQSIHMIYRFIIFAKSFLKKQPPPHKEV